MDLVILSWILAVALGLGLAMLTARRPMAAINPGLLWSRPPRPWGAAGWLSVASLAGLGAVLFGAARRRP